MDPFGSNHSVEAEGEEEEREGEINFYSGWELFNLDFH